MLVLDKVRLQQPGGFELSLDHWRALPGELHAVVGRNGAGKSSLIKLITAELAAAGDMQFHGRPLHHWSATERARHIAVLPQASELNFGFRADEVVALGLTPLSLSWREARRAVRFVMEKTDCARFSQSPYLRLSGGEKQRVHFARALLQLSQAQHAPLLLLDEPTSAQDLG